MRPLVLLNVDRSPITAGQVRHTPRQYDNGMKGRPLSSHFTEICTSVVDLATQRCALPPPCIIEQTTWEGINGSHETRSADGPRPAQAQGQAAIDDAVRRNARRGGRRLGSRH